MKNYNSREAMRGQPSHSPARRAPQDETGGGLRAQWGFTKASSEAGASWWTWRLMEKRRRVGVGGDCNKNKTRGKRQIKK